MAIVLRQLKLNLRAKIALLIEALVVILVAVTGAISIMREKETLENELRKRGLALANDLAKFTARPLLSRDLATLRRFVNHSMTQDYVRHVFILDPHGKVLMHSDLTEVGKIYTDYVNLAAVNAKKSGCIHISKPDDVYFDIFTPIYVSDIRLGTIRLGYSHLAIEKEISGARQQIFLIGVMTALFGGVVAYFLASFISSPIKKITDATEKVAGGNLDTQLSIKRNDEIGVLAHSFNKMTEDLLRTTISKDYLDNIIGSMNDTLFVVNPDDKIISVNKAACDLLCYEEDELIGSDIDLIVPKEENFFKVSGFRTQLGEANVVNREIHYVTKGGKQIPMFFSAAIMKNKEGQILGAVCIARDITEQVHAAAALQQSERKLRFLSSKLLTVQENERRRLSIELHDELGQSLMVLKLHVRAIQRAFGKDQAKLNNDCEEVIGDIKEGTENVRRLSRDLRPSMLEDLGLSAAIQWLVETFSRHNHIETSIDIIEMQGLFTREGEIIVYRIVQECLTNIAKHANATHVSIHIEKQGDQVLLRLEDNGIGFDVKEAFGQEPTAKGLGLTTMDERTRMLGGLLDIRSQEGDGTQVSLVLPLSHPLDKEGNRL